VDAPVLTKEYAEAPVENFSCQANATEVEVQTKDLAAAAEEDAVTAVAMVVVGVPLPSLLA
jgi:hypothetical protein